MTSMKKIFLTVLSTVVFQPCFAIETVQFRLSVEALECIQTAGTKKCQTPSSQPETIHLELQPSTDGIVAQGVHVVRIPKLYYQFLAKIEVSLIPDEKGPRYRIKVAQGIYSERDLDPVDTYSVQSIIYVRDLTQLNRIEMAGWEAIRSGNDTSYKGFLTLSSVAPTPPQIQNPSLNPEIISLRANFDFVRCYGPQFQGDLCEIPTSPYQRYDIELKPDSNGIPRGELKLSGTFRERFYYRILRIAKLTDAQGPLYQIETATDGVFKNTINVIYLRDLSQLNTFSMSHWPLLDAEKKTVHGVLSFGPLDEETIPSPKN